MAKQKLRVIPLGGLGEIGKNMLALECGDDIIVIDAGLMFPNEEMFGVDLVIPDITYLLENRAKVRGLFVTHGHEDHTGALPYVLRLLNIPVYATRLTLGLISVKLKENKVRDVKLNEVAPGEVISLGKFKVEFFSVCHSIPDAAGLIIQTPLGAVVHSGDFKLDHTPVTGMPSDFARLALVATKQPLLLFSDSTYAELPGYTPSERVVGDTLDRAMVEAKGRIIVTTFSSLISRVQQVIDAAANHGRYVSLVGRSMTENVRMALDLGYLKDDAKVLRNIDQVRSMPHDKIALVTTGSQGEPTSALVRIANRDHKHVHIIPGDTVVMSASPIPGNEALVNRTIDSLFRQGARVLWDRVARVHVHGHGSQEELKLLINLIRPKYFVPIHGEYRHLSLHADLARSLGMPDSSIFVIEDGDILELTARGGRVAGKAACGPVFVNGLSVGDIGAVILRDRKLLAEDGVVVAILAINKCDGTLTSRPDIVSRGFVEEKDSPALMEAARKIVEEMVGRSSQKNVDSNYVNTRVKETLNKFFYEQTRRRPMVLPVLVEV